MGFNELAFTKLVEIIGKMLAGFLGRPSSPYSPSIIECSWEYLFLYCDD
jgi:hypothetical protein